MLHCDVPSRAQVGPNKDFNKISSTLLNDFECELGKSFGVYSDLNFEESTNTAVTTDPTRRSSSSLPVMLEVLPPVSNFDWRSSVLFREFVRCLTLDPTQNVNNLNLDIPEEEDLAFAFDHHSLITSQLPDAYNDDEEPIKTAEEVIREIDLIMGNDDDILFPSLGESYATDSLPLSTTLMEANAISEADLETLSLSQLNAFLEELEACVREYSAVLVQELAYREELDFEQEQKDIFIARLDEMHRRLERRRRRSSMPPINRTIDVDCIRNGNEQSEEGPEIEEFEPADVFEEPFAKSSALISHHSTDQTAMFSRAQSAAHAAVAAASSATALLKRQWHRLSRGPDELAMMDQAQNHENPPSYSTASRERHDHSEKGLHNGVSHSSRAATIVRLRKWASRKANEALNVGAGGSFRALLRRTTKPTNADSVVPMCIREARSAVTTPTSSPVEIPIIPPILTHSASGHLIGNQEMSAEILEYKNLTTTIPYHRSPYEEGPTVEQLQVFNEMLLAILTNNPNLTPMLTDYILNVYAPAEARPSKLPI